MYKMFVLWQLQDIADNNMMNVLANEQQITSFFAGEIEGKELLLDEWEVMVLTMLAVVINI